MASRNATEHTKHVSLPVLTTTLVGNVGGNAHVGQSKVFDREIRRIQATDNREAASIMYVKADLPQLPAKTG